MAPMSLLLLAGCLGLGGAEPAEALVPPKKPNLVWFLTDDQDQLLGGSFPLTSGSTPMPKTKRLMQDQGITAENWYIHTPICSPSRSELLTGRYFHNIKQVGGKGSGMHVNYSLVHPKTFGRILNEGAGYTTGFFGKYVNEMPVEVPPGWDAWLANDGGTYISPAFQTKSVDGLPDGEVQFSNAAANYSTSVIGNFSIAWIKKMAKKKKPFLAYIAPKAAHEPFNPAPWYADYWDPSWPAREPITENWNCSFESRKNHHGVIATEQMITEQASKVITGMFKNRWRTLMSVDDLISDVIWTVYDLGLLDSTYFFYSTDHGFQLGQFNLLMDKRHVYEWDTKIHLLARGPGIMPGSSFKEPGTQVDIAPTLLGLAGLAAPSQMDGRSIVPFLVQAEAEDLLESTKQHLASLGDAHAYRSGWRQEVFIEMYFVSYNVKCTSGCHGGRYPHRDSLCANVVNNTDCWCPIKWDGKSGLPTGCYPTEDATNNFIAIRELGGKNTLYAEFQTGDLATGSVDFSRTDFVEYYDLAVDPWEMRNLFSSTPAAVLSPLHSRLHRWAACAGPSCDPNLWSPAPQLEEIVV